MRDDIKVSRRDFIRRTAAIGAALSLAPALDRVEAAAKAVVGGNGAIVRKDGMLWRLCPEWWRQGLPLGCWLSQP